MSKNIAESDAERCRLNRWGPGTILRGYESWGSEGRYAGTWTTIEITAVGKEQILARRVASEHVNHDGTTTSAKVHDHEGVWTLKYRDWLLAPEAGR